MPHASAALSRETKCDEVRRKFHVGRGGTASGPCRIIIAIFDLVNVHLVDVSAFQRFRHLVYRIETRCIGLSQSGSASRSPCSRPPHIPRHLWLSGALGGEGWNQTLPVAQGIVLIPSVRCTLEMCVFSGQQQQWGSDTAYVEVWYCLYLSLKKESTRARCADVEPNVRRG